MKLCANLTILLVKKCALDKESRGAVSLATSLDVIGNQGLMCPKKTVIMQLQLLVHQKVCNNV